MAAIRGRDTGPEVYIRHLLFARGYRYRKNSPSVPGHPDLWLRRYRTAIFVHGCFWHRHPGCRYACTPKSNLPFWSAKFARNVQRDAQVRQQLAQQGIRVLIVWECTVRSMVRSPETQAAVLARMEEFLRGEEPFLEL